MEFDYREYDTDEEHPHQFGIEISDVFLAAFPTTREQGEALLFQMAEVLGYVVECAE